MAQPMNILAELQRRGFTTEDRTDYSTVRPGGLYSRWKHPDGRVWLHGMSFVGDETGIIQPCVHKAVIHDEASGRIEAWDYTCQELNNYGRKHGEAALFDFINDNAGKQADMP